MPRDATGALFYIDRPENIHQPVFVVVMKIALAQMEIVQGEIAANLGKIKRFAQTAAIKKADVLIFPEYSLTGSVRQRPDLIDKKGAYRKIFARLARENKIDIVSGSFVELSGGKPYNTSCYF